MKISLQLEIGWVSSLIASIFVLLCPANRTIVRQTRERSPEKSIYNRPWDRECEGEASGVRARGGDVMIRLHALRAVAGYRDDIIAGEKPELCVRLRMAGWRTCRLDTEMTSDDAAMTRFGQWWTRVLRNGYAFAHGAYLHGNSAGRHWVWESRRAWIWGVGLPLTCLSAGLLFGPWGWLTWLIFSLQVLRQSYRNSGTPRKRLVLSLFQLLAHFPEAAGEIKFMRDRILGRRSRLIEYK
jgi:hypothetical protein